MSKNKGTVSVDSRYGYMTAPGTAAPNTLPRADPALGRRLEYMPQLDSLRAAAVGIVMLWHFTSRATYARALAVNLGVRLFFVLSGFLISAILLLARDEYQAGAVSLRSAAGRFYLRRALRIVPIYYLTLLAGVAVRLPGVVDSFWWHAAYLSNVKFAIAGFAAPTSHFWTLSVEEQFYLVWPWLVLCTTTSQLRRVAIAAIAIAPLFRGIAVLTGHALAADLLVFGELDSLAAGALMATYWYERRLGAVLHQGRWLFALTALVLVALLTTGLARTQPVASTTDTLFTMLLVPLVGGAALRFRGVTGRLVEARPVRYVGKISYGIYVYHNFMPEVVHALGRAAGLHVPTTGIASVATLTIASVCVASVSWFAIERPIARLKAHLQAG